jgi:hypothetical protein
MKLLYAIHLVLALRNIGLATPIRFVFQSTSRVIIDNVPFGVLPWTITAFANTSNRQQTFSEFFIDWHMTCLGRVSRLFRLMV